MVTEHESAERSLTDRRRRIVDLVREEGYVQVRRLAGLLGVSEVTIRQDLRGLDELGELQRVRGGAAVAASTRHIRTVPDWADPAVGAMAAAFIRSGDRIVLDGGCDVRAVAEALVNRRDLLDVTVYTESLHLIAPFMAHRDRFAVVVPTGTLAHSLQVVPASDEMLAADLSVLGCAGIGPDGVLAQTEADAFARRRAALAGRRGIVVIPPGAFDSPGPHVACSLDHVDACIASDQPPRAVAAVLKKAGLQIFVAS